MSSCRECKLWDIEAAKDSRGYVRKGRFARCMWKSKEQYPFSVNLTYVLRPVAGYTCAEDGHRCPCFQKREG